MKHVFPQKTTRLAQRNISPYQATHSKGHTIKSPPSGIDMVDTQTVQRMPTQQPAPPAPENKTGLPDNLKAGIEALSGYAMDDVKVHYNSAKPAQLQALAYTQGTDIHVAPGQERYLPHEAWHVVQQKQGRVQPTMQMKGLEINNNEGLEKEAEVMGRKTLVAPHNKGARGKEKREVLNSPKVLQAFRLGKIPTAAWRTAHIIARAEYLALANGTTYHHDVADFSPAMRDDILDENDAHFTAHGGVIPNPIPAAGANYASDESSNQVWRARDLVGQLLNIDHIIEYVNWGCNDFRNARVVSAQENNPGPYQGQQQTRLESFPTIPSQ
jgi:hypothetical protein